jgi:hypothetical protein
MDRRFFVVCSVLLFPLLGGPLGAQYQEQTRLVPTVVEPQLQSGFGVAISADGDTAIAGAIGDDCAAGADCGSAVVFVRNGTTWTEQQRLTAPDGVDDDLFGRSVALSANGDVALIGAMRAECGAIPDCGAAYVFTRSGGVWSFQTKLMPSDPATFKDFGFSVALSADGTRALIGAPRGETCPDLGISCGAAYSFVDSGGVWMEEDKLTQSDPEMTEFFGSSVALSSDASIALIGATFDHCGPQSCGAAYIFFRGGAVWTEQQKLTPTVPQPGSGFGTSVALSATGDTAMIGAPGYPPVELPAGPEPGLFYGAAFIFQRSGGTWLEQHAFLDIYGSGGTSVDLSDSGDIAAFGAPGDFLVDPDIGGAAYVYQRSGGVWNTVFPLISPTSQIGDGFGNSVALSADASTALVGAPGEDVAGIESGASHVFVVAAAVIEVPTAGEWGLIALALLTALAGTAILRRL